MSDPKCTCINGRRKLSDGTEVLCGCMNSGLIPKEKVSEVPVLKVGDHIHYFSYPHPTNRFRTQNWHKGTVLDVHHDGTYIKIQASVSWGKEWIRWFDLRRITCIKI